MKLKSTFTLFIALSIPTLAFAERSIECLLDVVVTPSQNNQQPKTAYTKIKNDSFPMLLIGIEIEQAIAINTSKKINSHQKYCSSLIGQQKKAYLSGPHTEDNIKIKIGDHLKLRNRHSSGKSYPYWPEFYDVVE